MRDSISDLAIDANHVTKVYGSGALAFHALKGVDFQVRRGEFVMLAGPSGSGKTTLLNMIGLLDRPTEGRIRLSGRDVTGATRTEQFALRRRTVSFVFQSLLVFALQLAEAVGIKIVPKLGDTRHERGKFD